MLRHQNQTQNFSLIPSRNGVRDSYAGMMLRRVFFCKEKMGVAQDVLFFYNTSQYYKPVLLRMESLLSLVSSWSVVDNRSTVGGKTGATPPRVGEDLDLIETLNLRISPAAPRLGDEDRAKTPSSGPGPCE